MLPQLGRVFLPMIVIWMNLIKLMVIVLEIMAISIMDGCQCLMLSAVQLMWLLLKY